MRLIFSMRHSGSLRIYESVLRRLAADGHDVLIVANRRDHAGSGAAAAPEALLADAPQIHWQWEDLPSNAWLELATALRIWLDYLRYFEPRYAGAPRLRERAAERVPRLLRRVTGRATASRVPGAEGVRRALAMVLRAIERALPRQHAFDALMREYRPDLVLVTPLLHLGSPQVEVLRSARAFGARTGFCVGSWDHLSSKSLIRERPDRVFVWNETQRREAVDLHGVPADRVVVTGAQCYDQWFGRKPVRTREQFCAMVDLPPDRPFLLWVCSALFAGSPSEARFVRRWIEEIRASDDEALRTAGILVRPHPARRDEWDEVDLSDLRDVTLYGAMPVDAHSKEDYFESLSYSAAVVGLNTSAFLEAAIVGRHVHTIVLPEFNDNQEGTLHFHYLLSVGGGLLEVSRGFADHRLALAASLRQATPAQRSVAFVDAFIRPHGLTRSATDTFVDAVEDLGRSPAPLPSGAPWWAPAIHVGLWPLALATRALVEKATQPSNRTFVELQRLRRKDDHRRSREAEELRRKADREAQRLEKTRRVEAARQEELRGRDERIAAGEQQKRHVKAGKARQKLQRERAKRRAAFVNQVKRRIGVD